MDRLKRNNYKLTGSVHTLQMQVPGEVFVPEDMAGVSCLLKRNKQEELYSLLKINPNALMGDVWTYQEYQDAMQEILSVLNVTDYRITRTDLRLDSLQDGFFRQYWKIHRYLLSGLAKAYGASNKYRTEKLDSDKKISLSVKTRGFEIEFYDKQDETNGTDIVTARLEERSKVRGNATLTDLRQEFNENWQNRWQNALDNLYYVRRDYNEMMLEEFKSQVISQRLKVNEFLLCNADKFFTRNQLIQFLYATDHIENPEYVANNFKRRYADKCDIEFYSMADCRYVVNEIKRATSCFFDNENVSDVTQNATA